MHKPIRNLVLLVFFLLIISKSIGQKNDSYLDLDKNSVLTTNLNSPQSSNFLFTNNLFRENRTTKYQFHKNNEKYTSLLLQSTLLPGLGLSKIDKGKPYWIIGAVGYGCVIASITSFQLRNTSYNNYLKEEDINKRAEYHDKVVKQDKTAKIFAFAAVGTWLANYTWLTIKWKKNKPGLESRTYNSNYLDFYSYYDYSIKGAAFTFSYKF